MRLLLAVAFAFQNTLALLLCRIPHHAHYRVQLRERAASITSSANDGVDNTQILKLLEQIESVERLLASLRRSQGSASEEYAKLETGLERYRAQAVAAMPVTRELQHPPARIADVQATQLARAKAARAAISEAEAVEMEFGRDPRRACVHKRPSPSCRRRLSPKLSGAPFGTCPFAGRRGSRTTRSCLTNSLRARGRPNRSRVAALPKCR